MRILYDISELILIFVCGIRIVCYLAAHVIEKLDPNIHYTGNISSDLFNPIIVLLLLYIVSKLRKYETTNNNPAADDDKPE